MIDLLKGHDIGDVLRNLMLHSRAAGLSLLRRSKSETEEVFTCGMFPESLSEAQKRIEAATTITAVPMEHFAPASKAPILFDIGGLAAAHYYLLYHRISLPILFQRRVGPELLHRLIVPIFQHETNLLAHEVSALHNEISLASTSTLAMLNTFDGSHAQQPFEVTLDYLGKLCSLQYGSIWENHDDSFLTLEALSNCNIDLYDKTCLPKGQGLVWKALVPGSPKIQRLTSSEVESIANKNVYSLYKDCLLHVIRLGSDTKPYGAACIASRDASFQLDSHILNTFEQFIALELKSRRTELTNKVYLSMQSLFDQTDQEITSVCKTICRQLITILDCQAATIVLKQNLNPAEAIMFVTASEVATGLHQSEQHKAFLSGTQFQYYVDKTSLTGTVAFTKEPLLSNGVSGDVRNSHRFRETAPPEPLGATNDTWIGVPILTSDKRCLGVLRCSGKMTDIHRKRFNYIFDSLDQMLLTNAASIIAPLLQRIQSTQQLQNLNQELELAESIREHEMRGPLQLIGSQAGFVLKNLNNLSSTSKPRRLQTVLTNVSICTTLLTSTQLPNEEDFSLELQPLNLKDMLLSIADVLNLQIESQSSGTVSLDSATQEYQIHCNQFMKVDVIGACPECIGHPIYLQRAFYNIGTNAVKYARRSQVGRLTIDLSTDISGRYARILFKDTGLGIDPSEEQNLFVGRYRGSASKGRRGKGLGLKIAKGIIDLHNGTVRVVKPSNPTTFEVLLPLANLRD